MVNVERDKLWGLVTELPKGLILRLSLWSWNPMQTRLVTATMKVLLNILSWKNGTKKRIFQLNIYFLQKKFKFVIYRQSPIFSKSLAKTESHNFLMTHKVAVVSHYKYGNFCPTWCCYTYRHKMKVIYLKSFKGLTELCLYMMRMLIY